MIGPSRSRSFASFITRLQDLFAPSRHATRRSARRYVPRLESLESRVVFNTYPVLTTADTGTNSLRWAIQQSNASTGIFDTISFNIPTTDPGYNSATGTFTIKPASALPAITDPVLIDGTTQSGYSSHPLIEVDGAGASGGTVDGFDVAAGSTTIKGLCINRFTGDGIALYSGGSDVLAGNYLGTDPSGTTGLANGVLDVLVESANNTIGGTIAAAANVLSGSGQVGMQIYGTLATGNLIEGNYIGTNATGTAGVANAITGLLVSGGATTNTIGGTAAAAANVISGNTQIGVQIADSGTTGNVLEGNLIGTNAAGTGMVANAVAGVLVSGGATNNAIGGTIVGAGNLVSGNTSYGIWLSGAATQHNLVNGNYVGTNSADSTAIPNGYGVFINGGAANNTIGGSSQATRNIISGNTNDGVIINGTSGTSGNLVQGNYIGTDHTGTKPLANGVDGILLYAGGANNTIGGTIGGAANLISGNTQNGVEIYGAGTTGNLVEGNLIGTNAAGTAAVSNANDGVLNWGTASNNTIGGTATTAANIISGNTQAGVQIDGSGTTGNVVQNNFIGTNAANTAAVANGVDIHISGGASNNPILGNTQFASPGTWTELSNPSSGLGPMMLLPGGAVMAQAWYAYAPWYQLVPDANGNYLDGNWSALASMSTGRSAFGSTVLPNGKVMIYGGETPNDVNSGEIYDPATNTWTTIASIPTALDPNNAFGDNSLEVLPNGSVLGGYLFDNRTFLYNPISNTWVAGPVKLDPGVSGFVESTGEETLVKLPGTSGNILDYELHASLNQSTGYAEYLNTATNRWVATGSVPVPLSNPIEGELGPAVLLPSGKVLQIGANGVLGVNSTNTALYDPSTNTWAAGPVLPNGKISDDNPAAVLPDGNVVFAVSSSPQAASNNAPFALPTEIFEYNPNANTITPLTLPSVLSQEFDSATAHVQSDFTCSCQFCAQGKAA